MFGTLPLCLVEPYKLTNVEPTLSFCYNFLLGDTPYNDLYMETPPERATFFRPYSYKREESAI